MRKLQTSVLAALAATAIATSATVAVISGFGSGGPLSPGSGATASSSTFSLNAGNCCGTPYVQIDADGQTLQLGGGNYAWGSAYSLAQQDITSFAASFTVTPSGTTTKGPLVFSLQTASSSALPKDNTGYGGNGANFTNNYAVFFDLANNRLGAIFNPVDMLGDSNRNGGYVGATPNGSFDLRSGHAFNVLAQYDGAVLTVALTDATDATQTSSDSYTVNLSDASRLNATTAYVGFYRQNNGDSVNFKISNFAYSVPEPAGLSLLGLTALAAMRRRR